MICMVDFIILCKAEPSAGASMRQWFCVWRTCALKKFTSYLFFYFYTMSRKYKFHDNDKIYFVSFAVINWIDLFIRNVYKDVVVDSLRFCQKEKGLELYGWCIMTSHVHLIKDYVEACAKIGVKKFCQLVCFVSCHKLVATRNSYL